MLSFSKPKCSSCSYLQNSIIFFSVEVVDKCQSSMGNILNFLYLISCEMLATKVHPGDLQHCFYTKWKNGAGSLLDEP